MRNILSIKEKYILLLALLIWVSLSSILSVTEASASGILERLRRIFNPDDNERISRRREGGSRTENCKIIEQIDAPTLTSLVPPDERQGFDSLIREEVVSVREITSDSTPALWFYVPYIDQSISGGQKLYGELNIIDENRDIFVESARYELRNAPGFIRIEIPLPLLRNEEYRWYFEVVCDEDQPSRNPRVDGFITYVGGSESSSEYSTSFSETASYDFYLENGLWHETIDAVALNAKANSGLSGAQDIWLEFLSFLQMEELEDEPILDCCSLTSE